MAEQPETPQTPNDQGDVALYNVVRMYRKSGRRKIILRRVTLEIARLHCRDPRTRRAGVWFDGFESI